MATLVVRRIVLIQPITLLIMSVEHPLDPATAGEIRCATDLIKVLFHDIPLHFKAAGLDEPPKKDLLTYLEAEHKGQPLPILPRRIFVIWYIKRTPRLFEAIVDVTNKQVDQYKELPRDFHGPVDRVELNEAAAAVMADPGVKKEIERLKIDDTTVVLDPWDYGVDGEETQERHTQVSCFVGASYHVTQHQGAVVDSSGRRSLCTCGIPTIMTQIPHITLSRSTSW